MQKTWSIYKNVLIVFAIIVIAIFFAMIPHIAQASPPYTSSTYGADQVYMGNGGVNGASSASYKADASLGNTGVGTTTSTNYQPLNGYAPAAEPYIMLNVPAASDDLGILSTGSTTYTSHTFQAEAYLASGYVVKTMSNSPTSANGAGSHTLNPLSTPAAATPGVEQFGINLVANTSPSVGANAVQIPSSQFSFGQVASGYNTPNLFKYVSGDTIAYSNKSSGITEFTVSYIYDISNATPSGEYIFNQVLVATGTY
jgi:hypothetical protein